MSHKMLMLYYCIILNLTSTRIVLAQPFFHEDDSVIILHVNVNALGATNQEEANIGVGNLGILFKLDNIYGSALFNVINPNPELIQDSTLNGISFSNNLLVPNNSGRGLSSFNLVFGTRSFYKYDSISENENTFSFKRLGAYGFWQVNNTIWTRDSLSTKVYISSLGFFLTYNFLNLRFTDKENKHLYFSWFGGYENRILGGDYKLKENRQLRDNFLGTQEYHFRSFPTVGFILEIDNFYGMIKETYFGDDNIPGFSQWQTTITVGLNAGFNLFSRRSP